MTSNNLYKVAWNQWIDITISDEDGEFYFIMPQMSYYIILEDTSFKIIGSAANKLLIKFNEEIGQNGYINPKIIVVRK